MKVAVVTALILMGSVAQAQGGAPASDARGVPVVSGPAKPPAGANQPVSVPDGATIRVNPDQSAVFASRAAAAAVPACSRTVTDRCTQHYEARRKSATRRRSASGQR